MSCPDVVRVTVPVGPSAVRVVTPGPAGEEVELRVNATHIQWRYVGAPTWTNLIALASLQGAPGREVELRSTATHLQWRYVGEPTWANLLELSTLGGGGVANVTAPITYDAGTKTVGISPATTSAPGSMSAADKTKLDGVAAGATANATDAQLRDRSTHTGTQSANTITGLATVATSGAYADLSGKPTLGTAAPLDVAATGDASSGQVVKGSDSRLSDAREWSAPTVSQADAEAGTATDRRAWTVQRVWQAIAAWWAASSAKTKLDGIATGATANQTDAYLLSRANHTGTQTASTISDFAATASAAAPVQSVAGRTGAVTLSSSDISGLGTLATQSGTFSGTSSGTNTGDQTITLTGDVTGSGTGSFAATLANTAVTGGSYGSASQVATFTVDSKGRLTFASNVNISISAGAVSGLAAVATSGSATDLTTGTLDAARLPNTAVSAGSYVNASITVDATGRVTAASSGTATGVDPVIAGMIF